MKKVQTRRTTKRNKGLLVSVGRTIGSTLGTLAAKTAAISKPTRRRTPTSKAGTKAVKARKTSKV